MKAFSVRGLWQVLKMTFQDFSRNNITKLSASLAYYTIFSLPGMMIVIITILDAIYGTEAIEGTIRENISSLVGTQAAQYIQEIIRNATVSGQTSWAAVIGTATLLFGATKMFGEIQDSINLIWNLRAKPKRGWLRLILNRLISFSMVITLSFLLLVSFMVSGAILVLSQRLAAHFPQATVLLLSVFNQLLSFVITGMLFAILFKVLPDAFIRWKDVAVGAIVTTILFMAGKFAIGLYLEKSDIKSTYGAAGSIVVLLLWIYYSAVILYFGAAFTKEFAQHFGARIYPSNAVWIKEVEIDNDQPLQEMASHLKKES